jgi:hypothetical protein
MHGALSPSATIVFTLGVVRFHAGFTDGGEIGPVSRSSQSLVVGAVCVRTPPSSDGSA